jgi:hypothetical protein
MKIVRAFENKAATDLSEKAYYFAIDDTGANVASAIDDAVIGVIERGGESGGQSDVCIFGETLVTLGGTVSRPGERMGPHTDGTAVVSAESSNAEAGIFLEAGVAGDIVACFVNPPSRIHD